MTPDALRARVGRDYPDEPWHNQCAGFVYYVCRVTGTVRQSYATATAARRASVLVSADPAIAPASAIHFWSYFTTIGGVYDDYGHTAVSLGGGRAVMTDPEDNEATWGRDLGITDVAAWTRNRRGIVTYLGWATTYGANTATITTQGDNDLPPKEDDMTQSVTVDNKHQFAVGEEFISHYATGSQSDVTRKVTSAGDEMHQLNGPQFLDLCDGLGIPRDVVRLTDGYVLNPQSGVYERGGVWSRRREGVAVAQRNMGLTQSILDKLTGK